MQPVQTEVRVYKSNDEFRRDAEKAAKKGWTVQTVTERKPRAGCGRILTLGLLTLVRPPKPELVVTYVRAVQ